ncbi:MAG: type II toxin-antitoxin system HicA family toxin [Firmicutes bacterium]|nr:type II toxin-antitoxin system HicA family toxin [Bacillota bacterium]
MKAKEILKILKDDGWVEVRQTGSHKQFHHPKKKGTVTLSYHSGGEDIPIGTARNILKQAGLK